MTEYDLRSRKASRRVQMLEYGFGPETMRLMKLCPGCGKANRAQDARCTDCGAALPETTLYDFYRARHRCCPDCGTAVTRVARYCPECGRRLPGTALRQGAAV